MRNQTTKFVLYALHIRCDTALRLFFCFSSLLFFPLLFFFLALFGGITFTLVRKFQVEFMAALYLASNMHEPTFKPVPVPHLFPLLLQPSSLSFPNFAAASGQ